MSYPWRRQRTRSLHDDREGDSLENVKQLSHRPEPTNDDRKATATGLASPTSESPATLRSGESVAVHKADCGETAGGEQLSAQENAPVRLLESPRSGESAVGREVERAAGGEHTKASIQEENCLDGEDSTMMVEHSYKRRSKDSLVSAGNKLHCGEGAETIQRASHEGTRRQVDPSQTAPVKEKADPPALLSSTSRLADSAPSEHAEGVALKESAAGSSMKGTTKMAAERSTETALHKKMVESEPSILSMLKPGCLIGRGGSGSVFAAVHTKTKMKVAVKMIPVEKSRFVDNELQKEKHYFVMEMMTVDLHDMRSAGVLTDDEVAIALREVGKGLKYLHDQNIVHKDIKPQNVMVNSFGDVKIGDFGIAEELEIGNTNYHGTPSYMSPEMCKKQPYTKATDIWSLGVTAFRLLRKERHEAKLSRDNVTQKTDSDSPPRVGAGINQAFVSYLDGCLKVDYRERANIDELNGHVAVNVDFPNARLLPLVEKTVIAKREKAKAKQVAARLLLDQMSKDVKESTSAKGQIQQTLGEDPISEKIGTVVPVRDEKRSPSYTEKMQNAREEPKMSERKPSGGVKTTASSTIKQAGQAKEESENALHAEEKRSKSRAERMQKASEESVYVVEHLISGTAKIGNEISTAQMQKAGDERTFMLGKEPNGGEKVVPKTNGTITRFLQAVEQPTFQVPQVGRLASLGILPKDTAPPPTTGDKKKFPAKHGKFFGEKQNSNSGDETVCDDGVQK